MDRGSPRLENEVSASHPASAQVLPARTGPSGERGDLAAHIAARLSAQSDPQTMRVSYRALMQFVVVMIKEHRLPVSLETVGCPVSGRHGQNTAVLVLYNLSKLIEAQGLLDVEGDEELSESRIMESSRMMENVNLLVDAFVAFVQHGYVPPSYWNARHLSPIEKHEDRFTELMRRRIATVTELVEDQMRASGQEVSAATHFNVVKLVTSAFRQRERSLIEEVFCEVASAFVFCSEVDAGQA